ncbi:MAG: hypothetical protein R3F19_11980 [Verrucomicrobiales bacterium]
MAENSLVAHRVHAELVYLHIDKHRGEAALRMGILEGIRRLVVRDFLLFACVSVSTGSNTSLALHLLRDLICVHEDHGQSWAAQSHR